MRCWGSGPGSEGRARPRCWFLILRLLRFGLARNVFSSFGFRSQSLFPLLANFALVSLFYGGIFECATFGLRDGMGIEEILPRLVATVLHAENLGSLEGVHGDGADEGDVNT